MKKLNYKKKPKVFLLDVDGVMTNGQFIYILRVKSLRFLDQMIMMVFRY